MTAEERVQSLHSRMKARQHRKEYHKTVLVGIGCVCSAAALILLLINNGARTSPVTGMYSASSMLSENAGGYVLTAVIAFMAGVVITVILKRVQESKEKNLEDKRSSDDQNEQIQKDRVSFLDDDIIFQAAGGKKQHYEDKEKGEIK